MSTQPYVRRPSTVATGSTAKPAEASRDAVARTHADTLHNRYLQRVAAFGAEGALKWLAAEPSFASITLSSAEPGGWRPIETAPKDGTFFLAWNGNWRGVARYSEPNYDDDPVWVDETTEFIEPAPTHWTDLPNPPSPENVG